MARGGVIIIIHRRQVRWAEMIPCAKEPSCNTTPPSGCPPCDYSGQGAACGTFPPGTPASCDPTVLCNYTVR